MKNEEVTDPLNSQGFTGVAVPPLSAPDTLSEAPVDHVEIDRRPRPDTDVDVDNDRVEIGPETATIPLGSEVENGTEALFIPSVAVDEIPESREPGAGAPVSRRLRAQRLRRAKEREEKAKGKVTKRKIRRKNPGGRKRNNLAPDLKDPLAFADFTGRFHRKRQ